MRILIVDDHAATVTFMRLAFTSAGHAVTTASSAGEAIDCAVAERPDVVLSDLAFGSGLEGEGDGCSLARSLRALPATAQVGLLAVSGVNSPEVVRDTAASGFDGFMSKPVNLPSLLAQVERLGVEVAARRANHAAAGPPPSTGNGQPSTSD